MPKTASIPTPSPDRIKPDLTQAKTGDNGPDKADTLFFVGQFKLADARLAEARTARKKIRQAAKLRGHTIQQLEEAMRIVEEDDDTELKRQQAKKTYLQHMDHPMGMIVQLNLFGSPDAGNGQAAGGVSEKAYKRGFQLGVMALDPDDQAYPPMTPEGQEHMKGWHDGQKVNTDKLLSLNAEIAADAAAKEAKKAAKAAKPEATH